MLIKGQLHKQDYMADQNTLMIRTLGSVLYCTEQNILQLTTASKMLVGYIQQNLTNSFTRIPLGHRKHI